MKRFLAVAWFAVAASAAAQTVTTQVTARLTESGDNAPAMPVVADAVEHPEAGLTPTLHVAVPNAQAPRIVNMVNPAIAIPFASRIREVEAYWNGTALPLIDPRGTELADEAHSYGSMIPFFKPLFSVAGMQAGAGTLEIRAYDASHGFVTSVSIPGLSIVRPPAPVTAAAVAAISRPRIYLTPARLATIRARPASDVAAQRFNATVQTFLNALEAIPDVTSPQFESRVYDPEDYIPLLALTYHLRKSSDPATANRAAGAAHTLAVRMATEYDNGTRTFARDTGYDIRYGLRNLMLAYDWMYDQFTAAERALIVKVATNWVDWYHTAPGYAETLPVENYYAGYIQGIVLTAVATAGDNEAADRLFTLLRTKLGNEMPILNDRLAGGDWAEGWNYGWYTVLEFSLVNTLMREIGEDWGAVFDWLQPLARGLTYQVSPDFSEIRPFGGYSGDYPHRTSPATLAVLSSTTTDGDYASRLYTSMNANPDNDFRDSGGARFYEMIFAATASAGNVGGLPLSFLHSGTGRFFSRSSLTDSQAYFVLAENISYAHDHYGYANGDVRLYHGTTCLVCPSAYRGEAFDGEAGTPAFSTYMVNGREQQLGLSRNNQNLFYLENTTFAALGMRFESAWASSRYDENIVDPENPLDYMIREVVHLRPGTMIVRDLHRRRHASDTLVARWHLGPTEAAQNNGNGRYRVGPLNASTIYPAGGTVLFADDTDRRQNRVGTLMQVDFVSSTSAMELLTVFSETLTASSHTGGVLTLSDGTSVTFANGSVSVGRGGGGRRRVVRR